jgi:hypothetical protein
MDYQPTIRTQQDLEEAWRFLMHPLGFSGRSTWFMLLDADCRPVPHVTQIEETGPPPAPEQIAGLADVVAELREEFAPGGRIAFLLSRPGPPTVTPDDRARARALYEVRRLADVPVDVIHLACDSDVVPLPMDEALPDSAA